MLSETGMTSLTLCFQFFNSVLRPFQDYFSSYETGQSIGGVKTGEPREKPLDTPASRTWFVSHVARAGLSPYKVSRIRDQESIQLDLNLIIDTRRKRKNSTKHYKYVHIRITCPCNIYPLP